MHSSRERFPGLDEWVRLDGPAGTLAGRHLDRCDARVPHQFSACEHRRRVRREPSHHRSWSMTCATRSAALLGAAGSQVIFGPSATALVFAYTRALARDMDGSERIVCTQLDHDSNVTPWVLAARDAGARRSRCSRSTRRTARSTSPISSASSAGGDVAWVALTGASNLTGCAPDLRAAVDAHPRRPAPDCTSTQWRVRRTSRST